MGAASKSIAHHMAQVDITRAFNLWLISAMRSFGEAELSARPEERLANMTSRMECSVPEFAACWSSDRRILVETEPCSGLEFEVSSDGNGILSKYWIVGLVPENVSHDCVAARREAENFLRQQHGETSPK